MTSTADAVDDERLFTGYTGRLLLVVSVGWLTIQTGRLVLSPLLPTIIERLSITPFRAGLALTVLWGLYALFQYPSGHLSDQWGRKPLVVLGLGFLVLGFGLLFGAVTFPLFLLGAAVVGIGSGLYPTAARALISDHFVERRGQAFGLHTASGDLGGGVAAGLAIVVLAVATWNAAFIPVLLVLAGVLVVFHVIGRESYTVRRVDLDVPEAARRLFADAEMRWLVLAYALFSVAWQGTTGFLPTFLQQSKSLSPELASAGFAALFVVGATVKPVAGGLGDRFDRALVAAGVLFVGALALLGLLVVDGTLAIGLTVVGYAAGLMGFPPVMQSHLMDVFPEASMGADLGLARTTYIGVGSLGPTYVGFVAERAGYEVAFLGLVACLVVAASVVAWRTRR